MVAHIPVILGDGDAGINTGFARRDGHIRGIGDQHGALHQRMTCAWIHQFGELLQHFSHFVAALTAADINDHLRIRPFGDAVLGDRLARTKAARDGSRAAL